MHKNKYCKYCMFPFLHPSIEILFQILISKTFENMLSFFLNIYFVAISFVWIITDRITDVLFRERIILKK